MSEFNAELLARSELRPAGERREQPDLPWPTSPRGGLGAGWLLTGLAVLGLGALAWYSFGPDPRRYLKIRNM